VKKEILSETGLKVKQEY